MSCLFMNIHGTMLSSWQSQVMAAELQTQAETTARWADREGSKGC